MRILFCILLLIAQSLQAATWVTDGSEAQVQSNIVNRVAASGDIITIPAGTNHWVWPLTNAPTNPSFTIQGVGGALSVVVGPGMPSTNTYSANASFTAIICDNTSSGVMNITTVSNSGLTRISGITFLPGTNTPPDRTVGMIAFRGTSKTIRVDHCHFWTCGQADIYFHDWTLGVIDHNIFWDNANCLSTTVDHATWNNKDNGHGSWADDNSLGTTNAVYIESNIATNNYSTSGILDGDFGGRAVVRFNTMTNLPPVTTHGTDTGLRSFRQLEYYGNLGIWDTNKASQLAWGRYLYSRGGTVICYSNASMGFQALCTLAVYRAFMGAWNVWGGASGTNNWDTNAGTVFDSGTHNGATGTSLIDSTKTWIAGRWATGYVALNLTRKTYGVASANDATSITCGFANGSQGGVGGGWGETNIVWANGDQYQIVYVDHAIDQAGLGKGDLLTGNPPLNTAQGNTAVWPREISEKCYEWSNSMVYFAGQQAWLGSAVNNKFGVQMPFVRTNADYIDAMPMPAYSPLIYPHPLVSQSSTFYVATNGSSANTGLSTSSPWTLTYALANAGANSTIILMDGYYPEIDLGTPSIHNGLTIRALNKWGAGFSNSVAHAVFVDAGVSNVVIDGIHCSYSTNEAISLLGGATIQNCWLAGSLFNGIYISRWAVTNSPVTVQYSLIESNGTTTDGTQYHGIYNSSSNTVIRGNVCRYNWYMGIQCASSFTDTIVTGCKVYQNLVYGNGRVSGNRYAIYVACNDGNGTVTNGTNFVYSNTIQSGDAAYPSVNCWQGTIYLTNNLILCPFPGNVAIENGVGIVDYNVVTNTFTGSSAVDGGHNVVTNTTTSALFVSSSTGRWWLGSSSAARAKATNQPALVDFFGNSQSSITDVGAFQYSALYASDTRTLDPSPAAGADYWATITLPTSSYQTQIGVARLGTVRF